MPINQTGDKVTQIDQVLLLTPITTTQRDALNAATGMIIYNSSTGLVNVYTGSSWIALAEAG